MADLPLLAEVSDLETRMRRTFEGDEADWAESVLEEASVLVRAESGRDWVSSDDPTKLEAPPIVRIVTMRVAQRALQNPDSYSAETAGDYSYQRNAVGADGSLYLTDRERALLGRAAGRRKLWTQTVTRGELGQDIEWVMDQYGYEPIPISPLPRW